MQLPHDVHGAAAGMADVIRRAEEGIRRGPAGIALGLPDEQQHMAATGFVVDVPLAGGRIGAGGGLALPVEQAVRNGVVLVHGGGGVVPLRLVERVDEDVHLMVGNPPDALANRRRVLEVHRGEYLVARVRAVQVQGALEAQVDGGVHKVDVVELPAQDVDDLSM